MPVHIKASQLADVSLSSSLYSIVYFSGRRQEIEGLDSLASGYAPADVTDCDERREAQCQVFFRPDKLGLHEKYI